MIITLYIISTGVRINRFRRLIFSSETRKGKPRNSIAHFSYKTIVLPTGPTFPEIYVKTFVY